MKIKKIMLSFIICILLTGCIFENIKNKADIDKTTINKEEIDKKGTGLAGYYFKDKFLTYLFEERIDSKIEFDWKVNAPIEGMPVNEFSIRWVGKVLAPVSGNYTFFISTDDGGRLWVDNKLIIDNWRDQAASRINSINVNLEKDTKYNITFEYYDNGHNASALLGWIKPGDSGNGGIIPMENLFPEKFIIKPKINIDIEINNLDVSFYGKIEDGNGTISNVNVDWGDGSKIESFSDKFTSIDYKHKYQLKGEYKIKITAKDNDGNETNYLNEISLPNNIKKPEIIVFIGDSITRNGNDNEKGYVKLIGKKYTEEFPEKKLNIIGKGIGGDKVAGVKSRLKTDVLDYKPNIVVVYIGINDVWHGGLNTDQYKKDLIDVVTRIKDGGSKVVVCTLSVIGEKKGRKNPLDNQLDLVSEIIREVANKYELNLVDLRKSFIDYISVNNINNKDRGILTSDTVHLNDEGNKLVAEEVYKILNLLH